MTVPTPSAPAAARLDGEAPGSTVYVARCIAARINATRARWRRRHRAESTVATDPVPTVPTQPPSGTALR